MLCRVAVAGTRDSLLCASLWHMPGAILSTRIALDAPDQPCRATVHPGTWAPYLILAQGDDRPSLHGATVLVPPIALSLLPASLLHMPSAFLSTPIALSLVPCLVLSHVIRNPLAIRNPQTHTHAQVFTHMHTHTTYIYTHTLHTHLRTHIYINTHSHIYIYIYT